MKKQSHLQKLAVECVIGWLPVLCGSLAWITGAVRPESKNLLLFGFEIASCVAISVVVHELAHFFCAQFLGFKTWQLCIGSGSVLLDARFKGFRLTLKAFPYSGTFHFFLLPDQLQGILWREFLVTAAGPLSNAILLTASVALILHSTTASNLTLFSEGMMWANGYLLLVSILPFRWKSINVGSPNDGSRLVHLVSAFLAKHGI